MVNALQFPALLLNKANEEVQLLFNHRWRCWWRILNHPTFARSHPPSRHYNQFWVGCVLSIENFQALTTVTFQAPRMWSHGAARGIYNTCTDPKVSAEL